MDGFHWFLICRGFKPIDDPDHSTRSAAQRVMHNSRFIAPTIRRARLEQRQALHDGGSSR